jgi:hypothetical protein
MKFETGLKLPLAPIFSPVLLLPSFMATSHSATIPTAVLSFQKSLSFSEEMEFLSAAIGSIC